jgi:integrase
MGTIRFTLRPDKASPDGRQPIELIYQVKGQRKYYRLKSKLWPQQWDPEERRAIFLDKKSAKLLLPAVDFKKLESQKEISEINRMLEAIAVQIGDIERRFELDREQYSAQSVVDKLKSLRNPVTVKEEASNLVFDYIDKYIEEHIDVREKGSLSVYRALKNHLQAFQREKGIKISFIDIDTSFFTRFQTFLITRRNLSNVTTAKQLSTLKTFLNYARLDGRQVSDRYRDFKIKKEKLEVIALAESEFTSLYNLDLGSNRKLAQVRDVFCFSCVTGLRYSDLKQLRREHITNGEIRITVKKTKSILTIPLNPYSNAILDNYRDNRFPLPVISNQKMNDYLKELCKKAGINQPVEIVRFQGKKRIAHTYPKYELISAHVGRKTFVTLSLTKGMTAEEVMKISGHEDYQSFKRYVDITEQRKKESMARAWGPVLANEGKAQLLKIV